MPETRSLNKDVSRETFDRLEHFADAIVRWTKKINLISRASTADVWTRHIRDSVQIAELSDKPEKWLDLGSGGGLPGIVVAILIVETRPDARVTLVESDQRKAVFLRTMGRELGLDLSVLPKRIETLPAFGATTLSARALAHLTQLVSYADKHLGKDGTAIFPKGATWEKELQEAKLEWSFSESVIKSETDPSAAILVLKNIQKQ